MDKVKFTIPGKPEYLTMIRLAISSIANNAGFDFGQIEDMKTAICEACKNISCHGQDSYSDKYDVIVEVEKGYICMTVVDGCDVHTLEKTSKQCMNCPQEGNLGIFVIETLMSEVRFGKHESGHKYIEMVKKA